MLSEGWEEIIDKLFGSSSGMFIPTHKRYYLTNVLDTNVDADHTYMMFSATFSKETRKLAREHMEEDFVRIKIGRVGSTHANIKQDVVFVSIIMPTFASFTNGRCRWRIT